ncbi:MAG: spore coat associated protein CotJA [Ruminococcaceae bacterium]|nr:spore coat associated protein CotJA [Oscillospiraceae bacterium]
MVYAPLQAFSGLYDEDTALSRGTLFSALDLPFEAHKCNGKDRCC